MRRRVPQRQLIGVLRRPFSSVPRGKYSIHPLLPGAAQAVVDACKPDLMPSWRGQAEDIFDKFQKIGPCMPKYTDFLKTTNKKDLKKPHVFMNDTAQEKLGEFYLCCALHLRMEEVEKVAKDNEALLKLASTVATEDVEPFFENCRNFIASYDEALHRRLDGTTVWREVDDKLFWHHSFEAAAAEPYTVFRSALLPPEADWPAPEKEDEVEKLLAECARRIAADGGDAEARKLAEAVYQGFLEACVSPVQAAVRTALIDQAVIAGEVTYRPEHE
eukprot:TRINITY_DN35837_c0_g1_i1.p1 TRINITY_DN35837_c0_g1~~TRINITY_DN35837_c0_g1_i1.p1  ORF type:complete len:315 (+),score=86.69 TRINITY_DN35837_c0_g1_i1:124-945(+)